ncbi:MAG: UDP-N-acetylmuramate dehydrogenase [Candidatus Delongbacteria bacterium]|nr:UDP-N-acetylmuramate dehydrogenase [Candidatus Delongbacteria bacterium]MBN2836832.1 UDP-N-acetylmuramate dehydrogenase [Candidatus Delongbacteria bacterium]
MHNDFSKYLKDLLIDRFAEEVKMKKLTTYKIGGPAQFYAEPVNRDELIAILKACRDNNINYKVIGSGSNLLVSDNGYNGMIINLRQMKKTEIAFGKVYAQCGITLGRLAVLTKDNYLSGFENLSGIPGTVGGALAINAGSLGSEISDHVLFVDVLTEDFNKLRIYKSDLKFGYRSSNLNDYIITGAQFQLNDGSIEEISKKMIEGQKWRQTNQPLNLPSCGSVFKKVGDKSAGYYIDRSGLKGVRTGGAIVSVKHANFILNYNNASSSDVLNLIEKIKETVLKKYNVMLETELIMVGFDEKEKREY